MSVEGANSRANVTYDRHFDDVTFGTKCTTGGCARELQRTPVSFVTHVVPQHVEGIT